MLHNFWLRYRFAFAALAVSLFALPAVAEEPASAEVPITRIVLFNTGVGFFEHNGSVEGTKQVALKFTTDDVNDLLKSIVLQDMGGGQVSAIKYDAREPLVRTLKTFTIDLTRAPTLADLLQQVRGQRIRIEAPQPIEGVILGIEQRRVAEKETVVEKQFLNLKTAGGLRSIPMDSIVQSRLLDDKLNAELDDALALLATAHSMDEKTVAVQFRGEGKRDVRIGYIQETPVWKASYRLVLDGDKAPLLQGWAIVENTGDHDWDKVKLSLVSGRPISFIMDLYEPLFVERPTVVPEEFANLQPRVHGQDVAEEPTLLGVQTVQSRARGLGGMGGMMGGGGFGGGGFFGGVPPQSGPKEKNVVPFNPAEGIASAANAGDVGELFRYEIKTPVSLARHKSAMLPIVNDPVEGKKLSIYNQQVQPEHPYNGFRLKNSTDLHLMQGPITVFDGGEFAGDARIEDVPPGGQRLISYAMDLDVEVAPEAKDRPDELAAMSLAKGQLKITHKKIRQHQYVIKNSSRQPKTVLVEQPIDPEWQLVSPKPPSEKTRDLYRFEVAVEPGKNATLTVVEERQEGEQIVVSGLESEAALSFATRAGPVNPAVQKALRQFAELKQALDTATSDVLLTEAKVRAIESEQPRIRQNLAQLDRNSDLYARYVKKLANQEDELEKLQKQLATQREKAAAQRKALEEFVAELSIE